MSLSLFLALSLPTFLSGKLTALLLAIIPAGAIAFVLFQIVKRWSATVDAIENAWVKRIAVGLVASIVTLVFGAAGVGIDCVPDENCLQLVTQDKLETLVKAIAASLVAFVMHAVKGGRK